jgi:RimJ/RimL family protein N-acetyltransferase
MVWVRPLDEHDLERVGGWLSREENYRWLDFGAGVQALSPFALAAMSKREIHDLLVFGTDDERHPVGLVAISNIAPAFGSGTLWYVLGDKACGRRGYTSNAVGCMLDRAFGTLGLTSVNAWAVGTNIASIRILEKNGFRRIGVQRNCHRTADSLVDRILFDKLKVEHDANCVPETTGENA